MDQSSRPAHQNLSRQTKMKKKNQQQVKVVHFSNPVRVTTTAAEFRALVQELTGRDSYIADLLAGHPPPAVGAVCDGYSPLDLLTGGGSSQPGIFDSPPPDFKVESTGHGDGDSFQMFGRVEDFSGALTESVIFETPVISADAFYGWVL